MTDEELAAMDDMETLMALFEQMVALMARVIACLESIVEANK